MESSANAVHREPWNKGKIVGQKAPFKVKDIWALRVRLQMESRVRELALFNLGIDSKLRGCDLSVSRSESTVRYLGIEVDDALEIAEQTETEPSSFRQAGRSKREVTTGLLNQCQLHGPRPASCSRAVPVARPSRESPSVTGPWVQPTWPAIRSRRRNLQRVVQRDRRSGKHRGQLGRLQSEGPSWRSRLRTDVQSAQLE